MNEKWAPNVYGWGRLGMWLAYEPRNRAPACRRACSASAILPGSIHNNRFPQGSDHGKVLFTSAYNELDAQRLHMHRRQIFSVSGNASVTPHGLFKDGGRDRLSSWLSPIPETDVLHALDTKSNMGARFDKARVQSNRFGQSVCNERLTTCNDKHARYSFVDYHPDRTGKTQRTYWLGDEQNEVRKSGLNPLLSCNLSAHSSTALSLRCTQNPMNESVRTGAHQGVVRVVGFDLPSAP